MYSVDEHDTVVALDLAPQCSINSPCPMFLVSGNELYLAYHILVWAEDGNGNLVPAAGHIEPVALVSFAEVYAHQFGPPNDQAFSEHPLASRGLKPCCHQEVLNSSWLRQLKQTDAEHPHPRPERFEDLRHFVFAFRDATLECIAEGYMAKFHSGSIEEVLTTKREPWPDYY